MKKILFLLSVVLLAGCSSDDEAVVDETAANLMNIPAEVAPVSMQQLQDVLGAKTWTLESTTMNAKGEVKVLADGDILLGAAIRFIQFSGTQAKMYMITDAYVMPRVFSAAYSYDEARNLLTWNRGLADLPAKLRVLSCNENEVKLVGERNGADKDEAYNVYILTTMDKDGQQIFDSTVWPQ